LSKARIIRENDRIIWYPGRVRIWTQA
jgi:hypothetical protein